MSERISRSEPDGSFSQGPDRTSKQHGAALGCVGTLLTLALGGLVMLIASTLLTLGPTGGEVQRHVLVHSWHFSHGIWLVVPATVVGYMIGYEKTLECLSNFWGTADKRNLRLTFALWAALIIICKVTQIVVDVIMP